MAFGKSCRLVIAVKIKSVGGEMGNERLYGEPISSHIMDMKIQLIFIFLFIYCIVFMLIFML